MCKYLLSISVSLSRSKRPGCERYTWIIFFNTFHLLQFWLWRRIFEIKNRWRHIMFYLFFRPFVFVVKLDITSESLNLRVTYFPKICFAPSRRLKLLARQNETMAFLNAKQSPLNYCRHFASKDNLQRDLHFAG